MFKDETDLEKIIGRLNIDAAPNPVHREKLRREMLSVFKETGQQPQEHKTPLGVFRRTIMKSRVTKLAAAAIAIAVVLSLSYGATKLIKRFIGITIRQVMIGSGSGGYMSLSPDGKYLCDVDWDTGNLVVRELATGNVRPLTGKTSWEESGAYAYNSAISRDSKRVAFLWWNSEREAFDLRTIGLDGCLRITRRFSGHSAWGTSPAK